MPPRSGWSGTRPRSAAEARRRILEAAVACVEEQGLSADVSKVAARLGVTRQTVYRYFPRRRNLFGAVAIEASRPFLDRMRHHLGTIPAGSDELIEAVFFLVRELPAEPRLSFILRTGDPCPLIMAGRAANLGGFGTYLLEALPSGLAEIPANRRNDVVELAVRLTQALVLDSSTALRSDESVRSFLRFSLRPFLTDATTAE